MLHGPQPPWCSAQNASVQSCLHLSLPRLPKSAYFFAIPYLLSYTHTSSITTLVSPSRPLSFPYLHQLASPPLVYSVRPSLSHLLLLPLDHYIRFSDPALPISLSCTIASPRSPLPVFALHCPALSLSLSFSYHPPSSSLLPVPPFSCLHSQFFDW